jgi:pimeloyl-ACP methyl ester carboxylesterase
MDEERYREAERRFWDFYGAAPTERRLTLKPFGISVRVQEIGSGPPALFLHGAPNSGSTWAPLDC